MRLLKPCLLSIVMAFVIFMPNRGRTQEADSLPSYDPYSFEDSLSIFLLLDSLLSMEVAYSSLNLSVGFNSRVTTAGRDFGTDQFGINPRIAYYHKSGVFADMAGFWNSDFEPEYNLTTFSVGYLSTFKQRWTYSANYERYFFHNGTDTLDNPLTNLLGVNLSFDITKWLSLGTDYSFYFGSETAHRIGLNLSGYFTRKKFLFFDRVTLLPNTSVLFGNESITVIRFDEEFFRSAVQRFGFLRVRQFLQNNPQFLLTRAENNAFGLMNFSFSLPVSFYLGSYGLLLSYHLNVPFELPGEDLDLSSNNYVSVTLSYTLNFK